MLMIHLLFSDATTDLLLITLDGFVHQEIDDILNPFRNPDSKELLLMPDQPALIESSRSRHATSG